MGDSSSSLSAAGEVHEASPLSLFGRSGPSRAEEVQGECKICFETAQLAIICSCFGDGKGGCCPECLRHYFTTAVEDALYAMPIIRCPLCRLRVPTATWAPFVDPLVYNKYVGNASALLSMRCPNCDSSTSFAASPTETLTGTGAMVRARKRASELRSELQREELWCDLLASRESAVRKGAQGDAEGQAMSAAKALVESWQRFLASEASADEFVTRLHCAWHPGRGARPSRSLRRAARKRVPHCIEDPERRMAAQLAWLRMYPKVRTPCCSAAVCFKCKVRGWHPHVSCEERQRQETGRDAQYCPNCQVPTTRSDGCTQIRCVCGTEWTWQERDEGPIHEDDLDDESDGSSEALNPCELLRSKTALELVCMNPALRNTKVIDILVNAPSIKLKRIARVEDEVSHEGYPHQGQLDRKCKAGHRLVRWDAARSSRWACDGCEEAFNTIAPRYRCEACDFDLCAICYLRSGQEKGEEASSSGEEAPKRSRRLGVRGRALRPPFHTSRARPRRKEVAAESSEEEPEEPEEPEDRAEKLERFGRGLKAELNLARRRQSRGESSNDPASSSSSRPERPELRESGLREALKHMAGALEGLRHRSEEEIVKPPTVPLPQHFAVRSGNRQCLQTLLKWSPPTEAALQELVKLPDTERLPLEALVSSRLKQRSLPLFARINFGLELEAPAVSFSQVLGTLPFIALRRQPDPDLRLRYSQTLRSVLGDEWFEAAEREALTQQLREELLAAETRRRPLDQELVRSLLEAGANIMETFHGKSRDGESVEDEEKAESETSVDSNSPWCPVPDSAKSCAELLAMRGDLSEDLMFCFKDLEPLMPLRRDRLLMIAIWSSNTRLARHFLSIAQPPLDSSIWRALRYMKESVRSEMEDAMRLFVAERRLEKAEVPFWALIQMGRKAEADATEPSDPMEQKVAHAAHLMHREACGKLEAALAAEDANAVPLEALAAIHKCAHAETRLVFQDMIESSKQRYVATYNSLLKRNRRAATRELLWELRRALCERRSPDRALAARLLEGGATMKPREASEDSDDEEGRPGGPRFATDFDESPRSCLDLLALNRFAHPQQLDFAIKKAVEYSADVNHSGYERPLTLAVRGRNMAAVDALLAQGALVDKQTLAALRQISDVPVRQDMEEKFQSAVNRGECSSQLKDLKDVNLWILVQSGNVKAVKKCLKDHPEVVDAALLLALRRCRDMGSREELQRLLVEKYGERSVCNAESQAATYELVLELREALLDERDPDEELVRELVILGANTQARGVDLESYIDVEDGDSESEDSEASE